MTDLTLTDHCPNEGCSGKIELTHLQQLPVVDCPMIERSEVFLPGMQVPEGLESCPLIQRIKTEDSE